MRVLQSDMTTQLRGELATYLVASKMARASEAMGEALRKHPDRSWRGMNLGTGKVDLGLHMRCVQTGSVRTMDVVPISAIQLDSLHGHCFVWSLIPKDECVPRFPNILTFCSDSTHPSFVWGPLQVKNQFMKVPDGPWRRKEGVQGWAFWSERVEGFGFTFIDGSDEDASVRAGSRTRSRELDKCFEHMTCISIFLC
ncbi:hypothetical protein LINPERHAP1_LOCUS5810 [Linum perenne]